jgi:hypothetical protein
VGGAERFHSDQGGQAIVIVATTMLAMLFMVGLAMDVGQLYNGRRSAQEAADSAAFAGAIVLYQLGTNTQQDRDCELRGTPTPASCATDAATNDASLNGYATDTPTAGTTVTASVVTFGTTTTCVQVDISSPVLTSLVPQQAQFTTVQAHAVACSQARSSGYAVIATDQTCSTNDLRLQAGGVLTVHGGSIQVNSCGTPAASISGTVTVDSTPTQYELDVVGTINCTGTCPSPGTYSGRTVQPDPFAGAPKPSTEGLTPRSAACADALGVVNQPGVYTADAGSNCDYLFAPGLYVWKGAAPAPAGNGALCTGNEVNTTSTTAVAAGTVTVTPASMANIVVQKMLVIGTGADQEIVSPSGVTGTTFTAKFTKAHSGSPAYSITGGCNSTLAPTPTGDGGVFFFITNANYPAAGGICHDVVFNGNPSGALSPQNSGTYRGMLLWVDSACTTGVKISGNGVINTTGSIYVPNGTVENNGTNATLNANQVIAKKIDGQTGKITMNYDKGNAYQGIIPALVN